MTALMDDGQRLHYRVDGPPGAPWLVFSNSLMTDLSLWDDQVARFGGSHRILRYDQRGHGGSAIPPEPCTFDRLVADLAALLAQCGVRAATVAGVSMGGVTALGLAARHPERVARAMICDCQPASSPAGAAAWEARCAVARAGGMEALADPTIARWFPPGAVPNPAAAARVRRMIAQTPLDGILRAAPALQDYDLRPALQALAGPVTFLAGAEDGAVPAAMAAMAAACPGAALVIVPGAGHLPNIEQPAPFDAALAALLNRS